MDKQEQGKSMRLKRYLLTEKTFRIDKDVDYIYKGAFKSFIDLWKKKIVDRGFQQLIFHAALARRNYVYWETDSSKLKGKECQAAHALNPVKILCGVTEDGASWYRIDAKVIFVSFPTEVLRMMIMGQGPPERLQIAFEKEVSEGKLKATIYHELSHWLNDTLHNYNISNIVNLAAELGRPELKLLGNKDVNMTHFEIDAQIHGIKAIKKIYKKEWDDLTINDVFNYYPSLRGIADNLKNQYGEDVFRIWYKLLLKRMWREKLLGKSMKRQGLVVEAIKGRDRFYAEIRVFDENGVDWINDTVSGRTEQAAFNSAKQYAKNELKGEGKVKINVFDTQHPKHGEWNISSKIIKV